ncbi:MAG TPA: SIR2 family protein, partial [Solirubrobacteraceae bacterium]|nr:SIR2 family protein [Solirubrobacteraceae bacterium]
MAHHVGDDQQAEPKGAGYFADASTSGIEDAIRQVAAHEGEITMFVGAGVSMEAELPSWHELVRKLLVRSRPRADQQLLDAWADRVLEEGPLAAASVAQALYKDDRAFRRALRQALYQRDFASYAPGALAGQIAWLKERLGARLSLLTVNYDGLLEAALTGRDLNPVSYVHARREPVGRAAVWHLHGRLLRSATGGRWRDEGNLILSEGSYVDSTARIYPEALVAERMRGSLCLFVGLSMTDPNFIRWLHNSSSEESLAPRFVVFVRQASPVADPRVRGFLEHSAAARWARYKVTPVWANYYGEVAQIVHEVGLRCNGEDPPDFLSRARQRFALGASRITPTGPRKFAEAQREAAAWLRARLVEVCSICAAATPAVDISGHHLGLGLWAVDHEHGTVLNWASSDRAYQEPNSAVPVPLHIHSRWVAVSAIANGVPVEEDPMVYAS